MKLTTVIFLIFLLSIAKIYGITGELKDSDSNVTSFYGVWLDSTRQSYDLYRDSTLTDSFRIVLQDVCDHVEPSAVIDKYYDFNYTDVISKQDILNDKCEVKFFPYGLYNFIARCCTKYMPTPESLGGEYYGEITSFDILINSDMTWTTGNFGDSNVFDREHSMRHEVTHGIGIFHNDHSPLMKSNNDYNFSNPQRYITDNDRYNYHAIYNPPEIIKPIKPATGYVERLLTHGKEINLGVNKPTMLLTNYADIDFFLLNEDDTYNSQVARYIEYNNPISGIYSYDWVIDTTKIVNKPYKLVSFYTGFNPKTEWMSKIPHDELKIRFSELTFESPKKDSTYISYSTLNFKVFGKSADANVAIKDIENVSKVSYLLEYDSGLDVFPDGEIQANSPDFELAYDLGQHNLEDGTYLVSVYVRDAQNAIISEIVEMPIKLEFERNCRVDFPLPSSEAWFDFETRLNVAGSILAEPSFADSLDNVYVVFDIYDDYWSAYLTELFQEEYHLSIFSEVYAENNLFIDSNVYFCDFEKKAKTLQLDRRFPTHDLKSMTNKIGSKKFIELQKPNISKSNSKDLTVYPAEPYRYRYPKSLDLWPGSYTVHMIAFRKDIWDTYGIVSEIAKCDSLQFIIPLWKMKLRRDYWFANTEVPYKQNLEYEAGKTMQILLWQPISWGPYNILNIDVVRETDSTVVDNFTVDFDDKAGGVLVEWDIPSETVPGFYNLKASNVDYYTGIQVNQQIDPQVCPLYLSWENSGSWPSNWSGTDNADWKIHPAEAWTPAMGTYALGAKYSTEGNTGQVSIQKSFSIDSEWDRILEFAIGVPKFYGVTNFDPLLADYSIAISEDGANWTYEKTAAISEYYNYNWAVDTMYCFNKTIKPLGKPTNIFVKFIKKGIVTTPPDSQFVLFDEVKVMLTKTPTKTGPSDPNAQYAGGNVNVGWSGAAKGDKALDNYYVYRNGIKIGETTAVTFVDSTVSANTFYNYAITAHYDDGSTYPESPMNECSVSIYTGLFAPSNLVITNENPNIKLTWSPISGASEYKVYSSNDPYGTFAEDLSGTFDGEEWIAPLSSSRLFYYVVAVNESMKEKKNIKDINHRVK